MFNNLPDIERGLTVLCCLALLGIGLGTYELARLIFWLFQHIHFS